MATQETPASIETNRRRQSAVEVSVVLPCLNEAATVGTCITKAQSALRELGVPGEVIVADNGSSDGSQEISRASGARLVHVEEVGYGHALMAGIAAARASYVVMGDADDSYDLSDLRPFIDKLREGYDLVMGNRFLGGIRSGAMPAIHRYVGNPVLTWLGRLFFGSRCGDFHCGLRAFSKEAIVGLDLQTTGMEFASEMIVKATIRRLRITEVPTTLSPAGRARAPHLRTWHDGWRHLRFLLLYSPRWLFLYPGALFMLAGLAIGAWLMPGPRRLGNIGFDIQTLLVAASAIVVGFQSVVFAVFTKIFAVNEGLLPENPKMTKVFTYVSLETGLFIGSALFVAGMAGLIYASVRWSPGSFGALNASHSMRVVVPSITALILGSETVLSSFFLSVLGMRRR